jgi:hypothetical protein
MAETSTGWASSRAPALCGLVLPLVELTDKRAAAW